MHAARDRAQQLLLPAPADVRGGSRSAEPARSNVHRASGVWQPATASGAVARGDFCRASAHPTADAQAGSFRHQAEAEHQQAASRAQDLPLPAARQDDRPAEPGVGERHYVHPDAPRVSVSGRDHRLVDQAGSVVASVEHPDGGFCGGALGGALARFGRPGIFNTDQGSQFTSEAFTRVLLDHGIEISMDGRGRCHDNIFVERLWWTVKHEWVYLRPAANGLEQKRSLVEFFDWYNRRRPHQALGWQTPDEAYFGTVEPAAAEAA